MKQRQNVASPHPTPDGGWETVQVDLLHLPVVPALDPLQAIHDRIGIGPGTPIETPWCQMGQDMVPQCPGTVGGRLVTNQEPRQFLHLESQDLLQNLMLIPEGRGIAILKMEIPVIIVEATEEDQ